MDFAAGLVCLCYILWRDGRLPELAFAVVYYFFSLAVTIKAALWLQ